MSLRQRLDPQTLGSTLFGASVPMGRIGFVIALIGILFAIGGAAVETALSAAYNVTQFLGVPWGKRRKPQEVPLFTTCWMAAILLGVGIAAAASTRCTSWSTPFCSRCWCCP